MVGWKAVTFHYNLVINCVVIKYNFAMNEVFEFCFSLWDEHSYDIWFTFRNTPTNFFWIKSMTEPIVFSVLLLNIALLRTHSFQAIGCTKAVVCMSVFKKGVAELFVYMQSLTLYVWSVRSLLILFWTNIFSFMFTSGSFVIFETCPF